MSEPDRRVVYQLLHQILDLIMCTTQCMNAGHVDGRQIDASVNIAGRAIRIDRQLDRRCSHLVIVFQYFQIQEAANNQILIANMT